ncbi:MAG: kelch repeat-containing protein [Thermoleophilaceae bacterium]
MRHGAGREARTQTQRDADPDRDGFIDCKVAANSTNVAPNGDFVYWNNLEATENVKESIASEYGVTSINDESRVLTNIGDKGKRKWSKPSSRRRRGQPQRQHGLGPADPRGGERGDRANDGVVLLRRPQLAARRPPARDRRHRVLERSRPSADAPRQQDDAAQEGPRRPVDQATSSSSSRISRAAPRSRTSRTPCRAAAPRSATWWTASACPARPDGSGDSSADDAGDTKLGDLSNGQLKDLAKELDNDAARGPGRGSLRPRDPRHASVGVGDPAAGAERTTPEGSLEGAGKGFIGATELEGIKNSRIYDPDTKKWTQTGSMSEGRWYPSIVTLPSGDQFVVSGLRKLIRGIYTPGDDEFGDSPRTRLESRARTTRRPRPSTSRRGSGA